MPRRSALLVALTLVVSAWSTHAQAATVDVQATVTRGNLSAIFPPSLMTLPTANLDNGGDQVVVLDLPFVVTDVRGTGAGWSLSVTGNGFWQGAEPMPGTSAAFVSATTSCVVANLCTMPHTSTSYPVPVAANASPVRFFNASTGTGLGTANVTARMAVTIPGNSLAGSFATTLTLTQSAGP